jgi:hypothetical protein
MTTQITPEIVDQQWLSERGNLHDSRIENVSRQAGNLLIAINDEWWNFEGLEEYKGPSPGMLILKGLVENPKIDSIALAELIMDATIANDGSAVTLSISTFGHEHAILAKGVLLVWQRASGASS